MKISVFGLGYVGCVSAACLARDGHAVIGVDVNPDKVKLVEEGRSPVLEPGLAEFLEEAVQSKRLQASLDGQYAVLGSDMSMICVGTPSSDNGSLNVQYVENVCREIGTVLATKPDYHVVVVRSTVLPGTVQERLVPLLETASGKQAGVGFGVCMNPEFLREGSAIEDYYQPSQIVIGELDRDSGNAVEQAYAAVNAPVVRTAIKTAEMIKYVNNAFHATKIAFANEIGNLCKAHQIDGREVMNIICQDRRLNISSTYLRPGFAFGGSCLPKDLRALLYHASACDLESPLLRAVLPSNQQQITRGIELVERTGLNRVGVLGLSFKANTDDVRESPAIPLVETLIGRGHEVQIYDEVVDPDRLVGANKSFLDRALPHIASLMCSSLTQVVSEAEVVVVTNTTPAFRRLPHMLRKGQTVIDLVGFFPAHAFDEVGAKYIGICW